MINTCTCCNLPTKKPFVFQKRVSFKEYETDMEHYEVRMCVSCATTVMPLLVDCLLGSDYKSFIKKYGQPNNPKTH